MLKLQNKVFKISYAKSIKKHAFTKIKPATANISYHKHNQHIYIVLSERFTDLYIPHEYYYYHTIELNSFIFHMGGQADHKERSRTELNTIPA